MQSNLATVEVSAPAGFAIERAPLISALAHVQSVVERRNTIPILGNVRLDITPAGLRLTTTDMDVAVTETINVNLPTDGAFTVPAHMFYEIVRKLPDGAPVHVSYNDAARRVDISSGNSRFTLPTLPVEDFPEMGSGEFPHTFTIPATQLAALFEKTKFAMSTEETRYYLNGIYLHLAGEGEGGVLRTVATDGHRLARNETAAPAGAAGMPGVIVPRKTVLEVKKLAESKDAQVEVSISANKIRFTCGNLVLVSKLIDGNFPDYQRVIPAGNDKILEVSPKLFASAVDRVSTVSSDRVRGVRLTLEPGKITISSSASESGTATETIDVNYGADLIEVGFNARYLQDVLDQIEGDTAQLVFADSVSPVLVRDAADVGVLYVVMPMRI